MLNNPKFFRSLLTVIIVFIGVNIYVDYKIRSYLTHALIKQTKKQLDLQIEVETLKDRLLDSEIAYVSTIKKYCKQYRVDPKLVMAVIKAESGFDKHAISHQGAIGLMQIMPSTYKWIRKSYALPEKDLRGPDANIQAGVIYLAVLIEKHGDIKRVLAEYNGGPRASIAYPNTYKETVVYVDRVITYYRGYKQ